MKILLAEDDNTMRLYFQKFLEKKGFSITPCPDGLAAWQEFQKQDFDLALLDWQMPNMTGIELCERIKQSSEDKFTYVIILTTKNNSEDIIEGLDHGADDYISKPVVAAELEARINSAIRIINYEKEYSEQEEKVRLDCYRTLTELAETRDHESLEHMERVGEIAAIIAEQMGMDEEFCKNLRIFAPMHDIGKVGIPDGILHIPRSLYQQEFDVIKMHTTIGWQILSDKPVLNTAALIAYTHHEHWDGTGYPRHLKGKLIPLEGRIVAVADSYDAMRSIKAYNHGHSHDETMKYLSENSGTIYDPEIIDALKAVQTKIQELFNNTYHVKISIHP